MHKTISIVLRFEDANDGANGASDRPSGERHGAPSTSAHHHNTAYDAYRAQLRRALRTPVCEWVREKYALSERECDARKDVVCQFQQRLTQPWRRDDHRSLAQLIDSEVGHGGGAAQFSTALARALTALTHVLAYADSDIRAHVERLVRLGGHFRGFRVRTQLTPALFATKVTRAAARHFRDEDPFAFCTDGPARQYVEARRAALATIDAIIDDELRACAIAIIPQLDETLREHIETQRERARSRRAHATRPPGAGGAALTRPVAPPDLVSPHNAPPARLVHPTRLDLPLRREPNLPAHRHAPALEPIEQRRRVARLTGSLHRQHIGDDTFLRELYGGDDDDDHHHQHVNPVPPAPRNEPRTPRRDEPTARAAERATVRSPHDVSKSRAAPPIDASRSAPPDVHHRSIDYGSSPPARGVVLRDSPEHAPQRPPTTGTAAKSATAVAASAKHTE